MLSAPRPTRPSSGPARPADTLPRPLLWLFLAVAATYVWLIANVPYLALADAGHDDALFVQLASYILRGQWLGPYNELKLAKGPLFSVWLAAAWALHLPLLASEALLYAAAALLFCCSVRCHFRRSWGAVLLMALLLLNPAAWATEQLRVVREGLYAPLTFLVLALAACCFGRPDLGGRGRLWAGLGLGLALGCFWVTREEGVWIMPTLLVLWLGLPGSVAAYRTFSAHRRRGIVWRGWIILSVTAALGIGWLTVYGGLVLLNRHSYGVANTVEFKQKEFLRGYGALTRVEPEQHQPFIPVSAGVLESLTKVSPSFAQIWPALQAHRDTWSGVGCTAYQVSPCDREWRGGWFMWALRQAAAENGQYANAKTARAFYRRLADEIERACADGRLTCGPARGTIAPAFRLAYVRPAFTAFIRGVQLLVVYPQGDENRFSTGSPYYLQVFTDLVLGPHLPHAPERVFQISVTAPGPVTSVAVRSDSDAASTLEARPAGPDAHPGPGAVASRVDVLTGCVAQDCRLQLGWDGGNASVPLRDLVAGKVLQREGATLITDRAIDSRADPVVPSVVRGQAVLQFLHRVGQLYRQVMPVLALLAVASLVWQLARAVRQRRADFVLLMQIALLGGIAGRLILLSYLDASLMPGINTLYMSPLYPMLLAFTGLALWRGAEWLGVAWAGSWPKP